MSNFNGRSDSPKSIPCHPCSAEYEEKEAPTEGMIKQVCERPPPKGFLNDYINPESENKGLQGGVAAVMIDSRRVLQESLESTARRSELYDYDLVPVRSPRRYILDSNFLPDASSTPILGIRSPVKLQQNQSLGTRDELCDKTNYQSKQIEIHDASLSTQMQKNQNYFVSYIEKLDTNLQRSTTKMEFSADSSDLMIKSNVSDNTVKKTMQHSRNIALNFNDKYLKNPGKQLTGDSSREANTRSVALENAFRHESKECEIRNKFLPENSTAEISNIIQNCMVPYVPSPKIGMSLETLDDKEECLSQLDEINVSALKFEEVSFPGLKQAQIVNEKVPLSVIEDLPPLTSLREQRSSSKSAAKVNELIKKKPTIRISLRNEEPVKKSVLRSEEEITWNTIVDKFKSECDSKGSVLSINYSVLPNLSHNSQSLYSMHSSDISSSYPCSTKISLSSFPEEIPNESLPYLLLHSLNFGKKMKTYLYKSNNLQTDSHTRSTSSFLCGEVDVGHVEDVTEAKNTINYFEDEPKRLELEKKVVIETVTADQVSKALNLCYSSSVFSGSQEQIEGERLLLLSTIKKQAALDEIQHLKAKLITYSGKNVDVEISINEITLFLRDDFIDVLAGSKQGKFYFMCLMSHKDAVMGTDVIQAEYGQQTLNFHTKNFKIEVDWLDDLCICFHVYMLQIKQHKLEKNKSKQHGRSTGAFQYKHAPLTFEPYCRMSCGSVNFEKHIHSSSNVNGQLHTRVPGFIFIGSTDLNLPSDIHESNFVLQPYKEVYFWKVQHSNQDMCDNICTMNMKAVKICSRVTTVVETYYSLCMIQSTYKGFLTKFDLVGGIGSWQRYWWCIKGTYLMSWKYPEDEEILPPILILDLTLCTEKISVVPRIQCARSNTFSIKMMCEGNSNPGVGVNSQFSLAEVPTLELTTKHILSADTREERDDWCTNLNGIFRSLQSWKII